MIDFYGLTIEDYLLERQIGTGGVAQVFYGRNYQTFATAAIKIAHPRLAHDAAFRALFLQEADINGRLSHPGILPINKSGEIVVNEDGGTPIPYLISNDAPGGSVAMYRQRLAHQRQAIPTHSAVKCAILVAEALAHAHQRSVLHLDIKPENLLLLREGNLASVVVADFGASALLLAGGQTQQRMGTPAYMSPEQLMGEAVDGRADLYGLAVLLYELLTGKRPFSADSPVLIYQQQKEPLVLTAVPDNLQPIIQKALAFNPANRFQTGAELAAALRQWQQLVPTSNGVIPYSNGSVETRLQAEEWLPPVTQIRAIDYHQRWVGGYYRFFIAHQNGRIDIQTISKATRMLEIGRLPGVNGGQSQLGIGTICLPDSHISEQHATAERAGNGWQILDKGSSNGTFLNGERLEVNKPTYWRGRTPLRIGPYLLIWEAYDKYGLSDEQANRAYGKDEAAWTRLTGDRPYWLIANAEKPITLTVEPATKLSIKPGETTELTITLLSQSAIVERVEVTLEEIPSSWYTIPQTDFVPLAGVPQTATILIHPPKGEAVADEHAADLVVFSPYNFEEQARQSLSIEVTAVSGQIIDLHPQNLRGAGNAQLTIWNTGNYPATYWVLARDPANGMQFSPAREAVTVAAGERLPHLIQIAPLVKRPLLPPTKRLPFELRVGESEADLTAVNGQLELPPFLPAWLLIVIPLLAILLYFAVPALVSRQITKGEIAQNAAALRAEATATAVSAKATIIISNELLAAVDPDAVGTPSPEIAAVQASLAAAEADLAAAEAQAAQANEAQEMADAISPIGPPIPAAAPPTAILLDSNSVAEDAPSGTLIGLLSSVDVDEDDTHSYLLVAGDGDDANGLFAIAGAQLMLLGAVDFEAQPTLSLRVQSQDSRGEQFAQRLTVMVTDVNEPFTAVSLDNSSVAENKLSGIVGELTAVDDPDQNDSHTFTILDDPSGLLEVSGASLRLQTGESLNYEAWLDGLPVQILAEDGGGNVVTQTITVQITDENDAPTVNGFGMSVNEDETITLTSEMFLDAFSDEDAADKLRQIKITLLPAVGQLKLGDAFVFEGQEIPLIQLKELSFVPDRNFNGRLSFKWMATDGEAFALQAATTTIIVIPIADPATFVPDSDQIVVDEDAGEQNFNWAVDIRTPDGDPRDLRFVICSNSNEPLFSGGPRVSVGGNLIFTPAPDKNGTAVLQILLTDQLFESKEADGAICTPAIEAKTITPITIIVEPINDAPLLSCIDVTLSIQDEGSYFITPFVVRELFDLLEPSCLDEVDETLRHWIAITDLNASTAWEYRLNDSDQWKTFPTVVSNTDAILLSGNAELRLVAGFYGTATIQFRAWDGTVGQSGDTNVNILETGGETAFSEETVTITIPVAALNDPPQILGVDNTSIDCSRSQNVILAPNAQVLDIDSAWTTIFSFENGSLTIDTVETDRWKIDVSDGEFNISGATIFYRNEELGEVTGQSSGNLVFKNFTPIASIEVLQALIRNIVIAPSASCLSDTVSFTLNDGGTVDKNNIALSNEPETTVTVNDP